MIYSGKKVTALVIDGVANGHRCCGVPNCKIPLEVAHPRDALPVEVKNISDLVEDGNMEDSFKFNKKGQPIPADSKSATTGKKKLCTQFAHKHTHNEQLFVAPCGMIMAQETFYHAEAIYSVIASLFEPNHIFFNNNCTLGKAVKDDPFFCDIALTVDVFHFKCKHSEKDQFCQENCNPVAYPELLGEGNKPCWFGGYQAICCEMHVDRYNFFFNKMICRWNIMTLARLAREPGTNPGTWPFPT
ncbi:hypothetical protein BYT27DRAFT_7228873 [Phlegmacium glaucopus]|nr:hypothetical protein BYT27DRAFT_7228873 [Phlegmacium glaucopus]